MQQLVRKCYKADVPGEKLLSAAQPPAELRRRWLYLMPVVFVTYSLAYLGRSNFGFGAAAVWTELGGGGWDDFVDDFVWGVLWGDSLGDG